MKRLICFLFCFLFLFSACSKNSGKASALNPDLLVTFEIEQIEKIESFDDETIKALSVIIRTKQKEKTPNIKEEYTPNNKRIYNIVKKTSGETLKNIKDIDYCFSDDWSIEIKNQDILKVLSMHNISLSSLSNTSTVLDENNRLSGIKIGGKFISYEILKNEFGLPSNKVVNIEDKKTSVVISGHLENNKIAIEKIETLANNGYSYKDIFMKLKLYFS